MYCSRCGAQIPASSTFCFQCGIQAGTPPSPQPFLSRKQFYVSTPQMQEIYEKNRVWQVLGASFLLMASILQLGQLFHYETIPTPVMLIIAMILYAVGAIFFAIALKPLNQLNKMYKAYVQWYKNSQPQYNYFDNK